jgi:transcriptional regulator with XRE-family HTH domain
MGVIDLASAAGVSTNTVTRLERGETLGQRTIDAIRDALENAGCIFIEDEDSIGVLLKPELARARKAKEPRT